MNNKSNVSVCARCVMDTTASEIEFDVDGICNHCRDYLRDRSRYVDSEVLDQELEHIVSKIKKNGQGKKYDCIIGVSGGTDSTYVAYIVKELGLRPLAVHLDNGWDSELAVANIEKILNRLDIELYTHVLDWEEIRDLQRSFLYSSTPDTDITSDHAIRVILLKMARKMKVKYLLNGRNFSTEGILPWSWSYGPFDWRYIRAVHKRFGRVPIKSYPHITMPGLMLTYSSRNVKDIGILKYVSYNKKSAIEVLKNKLGWRDYGGKHYESIFTRFFQGYILPKKFGIDKRKAHLSVLISSGELSRKKALQILKEPTMDKRQEKEDKEYFLKKLGFSEDEFERIMSMPVKSLNDYPNNSWFFLRERNGFVAKCMWTMKTIKETVHK